MPITVEWTAGATLRVAVPDQDLEWTLTMGRSPVTRLASAVGSIMPDRAWESAAVLSLLGPVAGTALRAGRVGLAGVAPNGQSFFANPLKIWLVAETTARLGGTDLGPAGGLAEQARLGDFWIPQRGVFVMGRACFTSSSALGG